MIPGPETFGFNDPAHAFSIIAPAVLLALAATLLYALWLEYKNSHKK